ncbi:MAG TPA: hypothetical protein VI197_27745 [Polyangiaceae bacterium]
MAGCTCYLGLPRPALEEILSESGCFTLMQALWHRGGGAWSAPSSDERDTLAAMVEEFGLAQDGSVLVDRYASLFETLRARYPQTQSLFARVNWPHDLLQALLTHHLLRQGVPAAARLASAAVRGDIAAEALGELTCLSEATVLRIGGGLRNANPRRLLSALPALAEQTPFRRLGTSPKETREYLGAVANDLDVRCELEELVLLYARASELSHLVLIG